jgi:hypothetical protein
MNGANILTEGLGSMTIVTEGYGYTPRADGSVRPELQRILMGKSALLHLKEEIANAFTSLRMEYGAEATVEALFAMIDETILAQPNVYKKPRLEGISPISLAQMGYGGI